MSEPIFPIIETDATELYRVGMERIAELVPGFDTDVVASPEAWLLEAVAEIASEVQATASFVPQNIFRYYGENILNIPLLEGQPATAELTVTVGDTLGHTIPEGTTYQLYLDGETSYEFVSIDDVIIPNGSNTATFDVVCTTPTEEANGAGVAGADLVDSIPYVTSIAVPTTAADGSSDETEEEYLQRLTDTLQLLSTRPITARDFEISARANFGGRWLCLDTYDADLATWNNPLTVTLVGVKDDGTLFTAGELASVQAFFDLNKLTNFVVHVISPSSTAIDVSFTITVEDGADDAITLAAAEANVTTFLSPENWALPMSGDDVRWERTDAVRYFDLVAVILGTVGVKSLDALTLEGGTADVALPNSWTLTTPGVITGTVA